MSLISGVPVSAISSGRADPAADPLGDLDDVLGALRLLVLDVVGLVDDHAAEAVVADPVDVPVEDLVVDHHDVGEPVDRVAVAVDHRDRPAGRPQLGLAGPVGLDDVGDDGEQRVGVGDLRRRAAPARSCRARARRRAGRCGGPRRPPTAALAWWAISSSARRQPSVGRGSGSSMQAEAPGSGVLERVEHRPDQLPAGQPALGLRLRGAEVGDEERVGQLGRDRRTAGRALRSGAHVRRPRRRVAARPPARARGRAACCISRCSWRVASPISASSCSRREQRRLPRGEPRQVGRDALEAACSMLSRCASVIVSSDWIRARSSRASSATAWKRAWCREVIWPRSIACPTSRTARARTGISPSLSRFRAGARRVRRLPPDRLSRFVANQHSLPRADVAARTNPTSSNGCPPICPRAAGHRLPHLQGQWCPSDHRDQLTSHSDGEVAVPALGGHVPGLVTVYARTGLAAHPLTDRAPPAAAGPGRWRRTRRRAPRPARRTAAAHPGRERTRRRDGPSLRRRPRTRDARRGRPRHRSRLRVPAASATAVRSAGRPKTSATICIIRSERAPPPETTSRPGARPSASSIASVWPRIVSAMPSRIERYRWWGPWEPSSPKMVPRRYGAWPGASQSGTVSSPPLPGGTWRAPSSSQLLHGALVDHGRALPR